MKLFQPKILNMLLFVVVACWIGIAAVVDEEDEIESLEVSEGEKLTISIHISKFDKDPQVLVSRLKSASEKEFIAQLMCHDENCSVTNESGSAVSLMYDGHNATLILTNITYSQTGLYEVWKLSSAREKNKIYNITVFKPSLRTIRPRSLPSAPYSEWFTAGISVLAIFVVILVVVTVIGFIHRKAPFDKVPGDDDTSSSTRCLSITVIENS